MAKSFAKAMSVPAQTTTPAGTAAESDLDEGRMHPCQRAKAPVYRGFSIFVGSANQIISIGPPLSVTEQKAENIGD
jgi:hypothetical protein